MDKKKEIILYLYFDQHLKQEQIAYSVNASQQYVSKVIKADEKYNIEKNDRKIINAEKRKLSQKEYHKNYKRAKKRDEIYENMLYKQKQHAIAMSRSSFNISDYTYAKWNSSIYRINKKGNLRLKGNMKSKVCADVPRKVNLKCYA